MSTDLRHKTPHDLEPTNGDPIVMRLLASVAAGEPSAPDALLPLVYDRLRAIAQQWIGQERSGHTLQATALVHEAYVRLVGRREVAWNGRAHFFNAAAEAMRRILIEHARARNRVKRGGGRRRLDEIGHVADLARSDNSEEIIAFDEAFRRLEEHEPRFAAVVRLRFYAGLSVAETAQALCVSERTVNNDWTYARAWLARELGDDRQ